MSILSLLFGMKKRASVSKKLGLYSIRKVGDKSIFKIEKRQDFFRKFRTLLESLGFSDVDTWHYDPSLNREFPIRKLTNFVDSFKNKSCDIDIIFTQDRAIVILKSSDATRGKFVDELLKFCEWNEKKRRIEPLRKNF